MRYKCNLEVNSQKCMTTAGTSAICRDDSTEQEKIGPARSSSASSATYASSGPASPVQMIGIPSSNFMGQLHIAPLVP